MKTWNEVTTQDVQNLAATATEGRLYQAITKIEWHIMDLVEAPHQEESIKEIARCQIWIKILKQKYDTLFNERIEAMERPKKCTLRPIKKYEPLPLTKEQKRQIKKRKKELGMI